MLITVLLALFVSFRFTLSRSAVPIDVALSSVGIQDLSVAAPAAPTNRLRPKLADLEQQNLIRVIEDGGVTTITIPGDDLFASGSAEVNDRYEAILLQIGDAIENHLKMIGMIVDPGLDEHQQKLIEEKRREFESRQNGGASQPAVDGDQAFPDSAVLCSKCNVKASILMDGCMTCLNCGDSKCG